MKNHKITYTLIIVIILLLFSSYYLYNRSRTTIDNYKNIIDIISSDLTITKNTLNQEVAKRKSLNLQNTSLLLMIDSKDSTIQYLQSVIKDYEKENKRLSSVVVILSKTVIQYKDSIQNIVVDSIIVDNTVYPTYSRELDIFNNWITGTVTLGLKTFDADITVRNDYSVALYTEKKNLFSPRETYVEIINKNPYTSVSDIRSYNVEPPKCNRGRWFLIGTGVGLVTSLIF
jgi:hypothetical protein